MPRMYIGRDWSADALVWLIGNLVRLAVIEEAANDCMAVEVVLEGDGHVTIADSGRGIPARPVRLYSEWAAGQNSLVLVFTDIWDRHPAAGYYEEFGFLNYIAAVLNAVSTRLVVETTWQDVRYTLAFEQGQISVALHGIPNTRQPGTRLAFWPDAALFGEGWQANFQTLAQDLEALAAEHPAVRFELWDRRSGQQIVFSGG